jgi:hypothetical protein
MKIFKTAFTKVLLLSAVATPLAMTACNARDVALTVGAVGVGVAATALSDSYYRNDCYSYSYDYYCRDNWSGWSGRYHNRWSRYDVDMSTSAHRGAHLANAEVITGGLMAKFHLHKSTASKLGYAFAAARTGDLGPIQQLGSSDLEQITRMQPLSGERLHALGASLGMSASSVDVLITGLQEEYQRNH